jgi:Ca-activated chloride channel family protein
MRRTFALFAVALASLAAAAMAVLLRPSAPKPGTPPPAPPVTVATGGLRMRTLLERLYLPEDRSTNAYLQIDLLADGDPTARRPRVPVNAVLILDRSGSMSGDKIERAREAARALVRLLGPDDRLAIVEFSSSASVLLRSTAVTVEARSRALEAIGALQPSGGTNLGAGFESAAPELLLGRAAGRVDKVFLASDGQANEGIADRAGLLRLARRDLGNATLSTFGIGDDYDEDLMSALAAQAGGRARYIDSPEILPEAFRAELSRAAALVARDVRVRVKGLSGASVERVLGYEADGGWVRVPDFAAGEERRVVVKLGIPPGRGLLDVAAVELTFASATGEQQNARAVAQATFTSDASLLAQAPTQAAATGASAEMAELAQQAAQLRETGDRQEARARLDAVNRIAARAARTAPARAAEIARAASEYERDVNAIDEPGGAASKKLKARTFDAVRAPVAGW